MIHGQRKTYNAGCRCLSCTHANTQYERSYRSAVRVGRPLLGAHVTGQEIDRAIAALVTDGFSQAAIARALGHRTPRLQYAARVTLRTVLKIRRLLRHWTT